MEYFAHASNVSGRGRDACLRCSTSITRVPIGGRFSHFCPRWQRRTPTPGGERAEDSLPTLCPVRVSEGVGSVAA
ncbi:zinc finger domain-containing protein [Leucobacter luti]|uniref:zinc finger domain-containing protein n=1 Tax=Leucobacter luti TaxID=340320 RepID=UPI00104625C4|nr:zinc finger domain-containing protein [Leucobacter luti]